MVPVFGRQPSRQPTSEAEGESSLGAFLAILRRSTSTESSLFPDRTDWVLWRRPRTSKTTLRTGSDPRSRHITLVNASTNHSFDGLSLFSLFSLLDLIGLNIPTIFIHTTRTETTRMIFIWKRNFSCASFGSRPWFVCP